MRHPHPATRAHATAIRAQDTPGAKTRLTVSGTWRAAAGVAVTLQAMAEAPEASQRKDRFLVSHKPRHGLFV